MLVVVEARPRSQHAKLGTGRRLSREHITIRLGGLGHRAMYRFIGSGSSMVGVTHSGT